MIGLSLVGALSTGRAQVITWTGSGSSGDSSLAGNWSPIAVPLFDGSESAFFGDLTGSQTTVLINGTGALGSVTFNGVSRPAFTFGGGTGTPILVLAGDVNVGAGGNVTLSSNLAIQFTGTSHTITIASGVTLNANGNISNQSGSPSLVKQGAGTLTLTGTNTYSGTTTVANGTLILNGGSITSNNGYFIVGNNNGDNGTFSILGEGALNNAFSGYIGYIAGSGGAVTVDGAGSTWDAGLIYIGYSGTGSLTVSNGGIAHSIGNTLGHTTGSHGTVTVTGSGSQLAGDSTTIVGEFGQGNLNITAGGTVNGSTGVIGSGASGFGIVTMSGNSTLSFEGTLTIGDSGLGLLGVATGSVVSSSNGIIGHQAGSTGAVSVTDSGSLWNTSSDHIWVGYSGTGHLTIQNGGEVTASYSTVGYQAGSSGTLLVDGTDSFFAAGNELVIGDHGTGTLTITNGGAISSNFGDLGYSAGGVGTATITGDASVWEVINDFRIIHGNLGILAGGNLNTTEGSGFIYNGAATVDGGSSWSSNGDLYIGYTGVGTLTLSNDGGVYVGGGDGTLWLGYNGGGIGTLNIGGPAIGPAADGGIVQAGEISSDGNAGTLQFNTTATSASPYYLTSNGAASGLAPVINGPVQVINTAGYNVLNRNNNYSGDTTVNGGTLVANSGAYVFGFGNVIVNNGGTVTLTNGASLQNPTVTVNSGGRLTGNGTLGTGFGDTTTIINSGAILAPGLGVPNAVGHLVFDELWIKGGGILEWNLQDPNGTAGTGWDLISISVNSNSLNIDPSVTPGTPFTLKLISLNGSGALGTTTGFLNQAYTWTIFDASSSDITGTFNPAAFAINTSSFTSDAGPGTFSFSQNGNLLQLNFTPVPEPSTWALLGSGLGLAALFCRRRVRCQPPGR